VVCVRSLEVNGFAPMSDSLTVAPLIGASFGATIVREWLAGDTISVIFSLRTTLGQRPNTLLSNQ
jgi:hypothetical protein